MIPPLILLLITLISSTSARTSYSRLSTLELLQELRPIKPPHCTRALITQAGTSFLHGALNNNKNQRVKLGLGVGQTVCFRSNPTNSTKNLDLFHTITLERLEQYHPITQRYRFAVPELETKCICECQKDSKTCQASEYNFGTCSYERDSSGRPTACHRTFFSDQPSNGCPNGHDEEPKMCCELKFRPYQDRTFTAVKLEPPTTFAILQYVAYVWNSHGRWDEADKRTIRVHLDGATQSQFLDSERKLEMGVSSPGKSSNQLEPGMYFVENHGYGQYGKIRKQPLNEITEHSFEKLGWFRVSTDNQASVFGGFLLMDKIHKAKAENCVEQKYQSILDANFYVNKDSNSTSFDLAEPLEHKLSWVKSARMVGVTERHAVITENEGTNLEISLTANVMDSTLSFMHNASKLSDFDALILVDHLSNSMLNITVMNSSGILHGYVKHISDVYGTAVDSFTIQVPVSEDTEKQHVLVRIKPYEVNTQHTVCLRPDDGEAIEVCHQVISVHFDLETNTVHNQWQDTMGNCEKCNQFSAEGFFQALNPLAWIQKVRNWSDGLELAVNLIAFLIIIGIIYVVVFKVILPLVKCLSSPISCLTDLCLKSEKENSKDKKSRSKH